MTDERTLWELRQVCAKVLAEGCSDINEVLACAVILLESVKENVQQKSNP